MKRIAYTVTDSGVDGREQTTIVVAFWSEAFRDEWFEKSPNKSWYAKGEQIVDVEAATQTALDKLNGVDLLIISSLFAE